MKQLIPFLLFVVLLACNNDRTTGDAVADEPKRDSVDYRAVIDETNKSFTTSALKGDSATFVNLYHPDANIYAPNEPVKDPKAMASMIGSFTKMGITKFDLSTKEVYEGDEVVTEVGAYEMGDGKKTIDKGKYIVIWKKDGDKWKLYRDIWNSDNPYSPPPPSKKK